jgi:hypothetical protein
MIILLIPEYYLDVHKFFSLSSELRWLTFRNEKYLLIEKLQVSLLVLHITGIITILVIMLESVPEYNFNIYAVRNIYPHE